MSNVKKSITFPTGTNYLAFVDLGMKTCYYDKMSGHLVEFSFDDVEFYQTANTPTSLFNAVEAADKRTSRNPFADACMLSGADPTTCDTINNARDFTSSIKCRFYD